VSGGTQSARENGRVSFYDEAERAQFGPPGFDEDSSTIASGSGSVCASISSGGESSGVWQCGNGMFDEAEEEAEEDTDAVLVAPREVEGQRPGRHGKSRAGGHADEEDEDEDEGDSDDDDNHVTFAPKRRAAASAPS
jgi:hypothetical protein